MLFTRTVMRYVDLENERMLKYKAKCMSIMKNRKEENGKKKRGKWGTQDIANALEGSKEITIFCAICWTL